MSNLIRIRLFFTGLISTLEQSFLRLSHPTPYSLALSTAADLPRSKPQRIAENTRLRQPLIVLHHQINKPLFTQSERLSFVLLANQVYHWKEVLLILKPDTLLRWHRQGFRLYSKFKSRNHDGRP